MFQYFIRVFDFSFRKWQLSSERYCSSSYGV